MKERPILFSAPMVRAILEDRKTQTRRVVSGRLMEKAQGNMMEGEENDWNPYGKPGDRLWVRETGWERPHRTTKILREGADTWAAYYYDADGLTEGDAAQFSGWGFKRRPSIFMPRWASRITLEIVSVRVERVQDICAMDAIAEGITRSTESTVDRRVDTEIKAYRKLWDSINYERGFGWSKNPWVWVIEFKRVEAVAAKGETERRRPNNSISRATRPAADCASASPGEASR